MNVQDLRADPRTNVRWAAQFSDGLRARTGEIRDVSRRGLFLSWAWRPSKAFEIGDPVRVRCAVEDGHTVDLECVVRWTGASRAHTCEGIGLEIVSEAGLERILPLAA